MSPPPDRPLYGVTPLTPDVSRQHPLRVYGPESIRREGGQLFFDVVLGGQDVPLPFQNVGKGIPVWLAFANVMENRRLAQAAHTEMVDHIRLAMQQNPHIRAAVTPPSDKSEPYVREVIETVSTKSGEEMRLIQLVGGLNREDVIARSAPGLVTECVSVVSAAKGITKYMGITPEDYDFLRVLGGPVVWIDDIINTGVTREKSLLLVNRALDLPDDTVHGSVVIGFESVWGRDGYPKAFDNIVGSIYLPEFIGDLPIDLNALR